MGAQDSGVKAFAHTNTLKVMNPVARKQRIPSFTPVPRLDDVNGKTIGLYWSGKPGGNHALDTIADLLTKQFKDVKLIRYNEEGYPITDAFVDRVARECDALIGTTGDCGSCTSYLVEDMIRIERKQVPTVGLVTGPFKEDARLTADANGMRSVPLCIYETLNTMTSTTAAAIKDATVELNETLVRLLTTDVAEDDAFDDVEDDADDDEIFHASNLLSAWDLMNEAFLEYKWGDGFPIIPPTAEKVEQMLTGTQLSPDTVVAALEPGLGAATVRKIAINAVMAGCSPRHLPILVAAVKAMSDPRYDLRVVAMSTGPHAPLMLVSGPIAKEIGLNSGRGALGPGAQSRVNTVIGRAVRLIMMNIGYAYVGSGDLDVIGTPLKYSMCIAENEEQTPWDLFHVDKGYSKTQNAVTMFGVESQIEIMDSKSTTPEGILTTYAGSIGIIGPSCNFLRGFPRRRPESVVMLAPDHAKIIASYGWTKEDVQHYLFEHARIPAKYFKNGFDPNRLQPGLRWILDKDDDYGIPVGASHDTLNVVVLGGPAGKSSYMTGAGGSITQPIE